MIKRILAFAFVVPSISWGAISGTAIQCAVDNTTFATSLTIDSGDGWATPSADSLLVYGISVRQDTATAYTLTIDGTFAEVQEYNSTTKFTGQGSVGWAKAAGTETSFTFSISADVGEWSVKICEFPGTDLSLDAIEVSAEDTTEVNTNDVTAPSGTATNTTADALYVYGFHVYSGNLWAQGSNSVDRGTIQSGFDAFNSASTSFATEVVSTTASRQSIFTTDDTGSRKYGTVMVFAGQTSPTLTLSDATPDIDTTVTATLSGAFGAGGNPTLVTFASGDTVACSAATSTTCQFPLDFAELVASGDLGATQAATATTLTVTNGTETSQSTAVNIQVSATGYAIVDLTCTAGTDCSADSEAISPMVAGDDCAIKVLTGTLDQLSTHCAPVFLTPAFSYTVARYDESASAWLSQETVSVAAPTSGGNVVRLKMKGVRMQ